MNMHPCTWASMKGRELKLSCPERVTLWQLAERAATKGHCWPSIPHLMGDTGLARQTVLLVVKRLEALGLIRIEKKGQKNVYHVILPVQNKTGRRSKSRPEPVQNQTSNRSNSDKKPVQNDDSNRSNFNTLTLKRTLKGTRAAANGGEPQSEVLSPEKKEDAAPPPVPPPTPPDATTPGGDPFGEWLADGTPAGHPGQPVLLKAEAPETVTEDDVPKTPEDRARMAAQLAALAQQLAQSKRNFAIPRGPQFTVNEHREVAAGMARTPEPAIPRGLEAVIAAHRAAVRAGLRPDA